MTPICREPRLEYSGRGSGQLVVLVHGTLGDLRSWPEQLDALSDSYRAGSYSRRYHYPNPCAGTETDYSATLYADDLAGLIEGLKAGPAHVVGTSYGAYTALLLAARHPQRGQSLVLGDELARCMPASDLQRVPGTSHEVSSDRTPTRRWCWPSLPGTAPASGGPPRSRSR